MRTRTEDELGRRNSPLPSTPFPLSPLISLTRPGDSCRLAYGGGCCSRTRGSHRRVLRDARIGADSRSQWVTQAVRRFPTHSSGWSSERAQPADEVKVGSYPNFIAGETEQLVRGPRVCAVRDILTAAASPSAYRRALRCLCAAKVPLARSRGLSAAGTSRSSPVVLFSTVLQRRIRRGPEYVDQP